MRKVWVAFETHTYRTAEIDWDELRELSREPNAQQFAGDDPFVCPPEDEVVGRTGVAISHQVPGVALWDRLMELSDWAESGPLIITDIVEVSDFQGLPPADLPGTVAYHRPGRPKGTAACRLGAAGEARTAASRSRLRVGHGPLYDGMNIVDFRAVLGHADPSVVLTTYAHTTPDAEARTLAQMNAHWIAPLISPHPGLPGGITSRQRRAMSAERGADRSLPRCAGP
jgi:hypothetical protein